MPRKPMPEPDLPETDEIIETADAAPPALITNKVPLRKSLIPELYRFVRNIQADAPYDQLGAMAQSAGWIWRMVERDTYSSSPGLYCVRFDVLIGKSTSDLELEFFDTISMSVPVEAPSPSLIARLNAQVALTYMVFGRLPPAPVSAPAPQPAPAPVAVEPEPEPIEEEDAPWQRPRRPAAPAVRLSIRNTPDGLPVASGLYDIEGQPSDIVSAALTMFRDGADTAENQTMLNALWSKNSEAVEFIKDFGSSEDKQALKDIFRARASSF